MADKAYQRVQTFCMWQGLNLSNWLRLLSMRPPIQRSHWQRLCAVTAGSVSNSLLEGLETLVYGWKVRHTEVPSPVFVIGHWRSGTTMLHNLLSLDPRFVTPNLYQVTFPGHFLVTESWLAPLTSWTLPKTRPMDEVEVTWQTPQEDEIGICLNSLLSPYIQTAFHDHRSLWEPLLDFKSLPESVRNRWKQAFMRLLQKVMVRHPGKQLLLKSPTHTFRIALLRELFPEAKFVYIQRNPYRVVPSTVHTRKALFNENGLQPFTPPANIEDDIIDVYRLCYESYRRDAQHLEPGQLHEVRLEDLERNVLGELRAIYTTLGLDGYEQLVERVKPQLDDLKKFRKNTFTMEESLRKRIHERLRPMFERYDYPAALPGAVPTAPEPEATTAPVASPAATAPPAPSTSVVRVA